MFKPTQIQYIPLSYSTSRMDGKLPNAFIADEVGALPISYPIEAILFLISLITESETPYSLIVFISIESPFLNAIEYLTVNKKVLNIDLLYVLNYLDFLYFVRPLFIIL